MNSFNGPVRELLDQYLHNPSIESRNAAKSLFRQEHWSIANTLRAVAFDNGEMDYVTALDEIMCSARIEKGWGVIDCSGGNYHLIAENLK